MVRLFTFGIILLLILPLGFAFEFSHEIKDNVITAQFIGESPFFLFAYKKDQINNNYMIVKTSDNQWIGKLPDKEVEIRAKDSTVQEGRIFYAGYFDEKLDNIIGFQVNDPSLASWIEENKDKNLVIKGPLLLGEKEYNGDYIWHFDPDKLEVSVFDPATSQCSNGETCGHNLINENMKNYGLEEDFIGAFGNYQITDSPPPNCRNYIKDGTESDVDCGGVTCRKTCGEGKTCENNFDCSPFLKCDAQICTNTCFDSDSNEIEEKHKDGTVTKIDASKYFKGYSQNSKNKIQDQCTDSNTLIESYCEGSEIKTKTVNCQCRDDRCLGQDYQNYYTMLDEVTLETGESHFYATVANEYFKIGNKEFFNCDEVKDLSLVFNIDGEEIKTKLFSSYNCKFVFKFLLKTSQVNKIARAKFTAEFNDGEIKSVEKDFLVEERFLESYNIVHEETLPIHFQTIFNGGDVVQAEVIYITDDGQKSARLYDDGSNQDIFREDNEWTGIVEEPFTSYKFSVTLGDGSVEEVKGDSINIVDNSRDKCDKIIDNNGDINVFLIPVGWQEEQVTNENLMKQWQLLISIDPYKDLKDKFNVYIFRSEDLKNENNVPIYRSRVANACNVPFKEVHQLAGFGPQTCNCASRDYTWLPLVETGALYGGSNNLIFNNQDWNRFSSFPHEFGHSFGGLGHYYFHGANTYHHKPGQGSGIADDTNANTDVEGCPKWCSGELDQGKEYFDLYQSWKECAEPYLKLASTSNNFFNAPLSKCYNTFQDQSRASSKKDLRMHDWGKECRDNTWCYMTGGDVDQFRSLAGGIMDSRKTLHSRYSLPSREYLENLIRSEKKYGGEKPMHRKVLFYDYEGEDGNFYDGGEIDFDRMSDHFRKKLQQKILVAQIHHKFPATKSLTLAQMNPKIIKAFVLSDRPLTENVLNIDAIDPGIIIAEYKKMIGEG